MPRNKPQVAASTRRVACFSLDNDVICSGIVAQISFVYSQEQHAISLRDKISSGANKNKIIVIVANHADHCTGCFGAHELVVVRNG